MQLDFYLSTEDKIELVNFLFSKGAKLIPSVNYESKQYIEVDNLDGYKSLVEQNTLIHIVHPSFTNTDLEFDFFEREGRQVFYLVQRYGGPTIDFYSPGKIIKEGIPYIGPGFIGTYPFYWRGKEKVIASAELKKFYHGLTTFIKGHAMLIKHSKRSYWVGIHATQATLRGYKLISASS